MHSMPLDQFELQPPAEEEDLTMPSPFKRILSKTSELELPTEEFSASAQYEQIKRIKILEYEVSSLKNQAMLDKLDHDRIESLFQKNLKAKDEEIETLSSNEKFLFDRNEELTKEMTELKNAHTKQLDAKDEEVAMLRKSLATKQDSVTELTYELESRDSRIEILEKESELKIDQLQSHIQDLEADLDAQLQNNNQALARVRDLENQLENANFGVAEGEPVLDRDGDTEMLYRKQFNSQIEYIEQLETKIMNYEHKLNGLSKNKDLVEVLKEERNSFVRKLERLNQVEKDYDELSLKNARTEAELQKWIQLSDDSKSPLEFFNDMKLTKEENEALRDKTVKLSVEVSELSHQKSQLLLQLEESTSRNEELKENLKQAQLIVIKNRNFKQLLEQEVSFSKAQVEFLTSENKLLLEARSKHSASTEGGGANEDLTQSLINNQKIINDLSDLVTKYKKELSDSLDSTKEIASPSVGEKRKRIENENQITNAEQIREITKLKLEIEAKGRTIALLEENIHHLNQSLEEAKLSHVVNTGDDLTISRLASLKQENEDLLSQLQQREGIETIPKSVYNRLLLEQRSLQDKLFESNKKQTRLKEAFEKQITRFNTIIYRLFGYKIEFLSPSALKVISAKFQPDEYLIVDITDQSKTLSIQINSEKSVIKQIERIVVDNLLEFWVGDKKNIPCFLGALNLELFEKSTAV